MRGVVLAIGGTDSSGGAGLSRDAAMATRMGFLLKPVVTAVTAQTDRAVHRVSPMPLDLLDAQLRAALAEPRPQAVKIGMVASSEQVARLAELLPADLPLVLDPVLRASSGGDLTPAEGLRPLLRRAALLTPNLSESARLSGLPEAVAEAELHDQGAALLALGPRAVLLKGGHGRGAECIDHLFTGATHRRFTGPRLPVSRRGTGCGLATAIACALTQGATVPEACRLGKAAVTTWLSEPDAAQGLTLSG